ncbi:hypothetical protein HDZ31DRAFT_48515 [Schizophyllum fasciatum]
MFFLMHLSAVADRLAAHALYRQFSAWILAFAIHARTGRFRTQPTLSPTPLTDTPGDRDEHSIDPHITHDTVDDAGDEPYLIVDMPEHPQDSRPFDGPAHCSDPVEAAMGTVGIDTSNDLPTTPTTDLVWIGDVPSPASSHMDLLPLLAVLLLFGVLVHAVIEMISALKDIMPRRCQIPRISSVRRLTAPVLPSFLVFYLLVMPARVIYSDAIIVLAFHLHYAVIQDIYFASLQACIANICEIYSAAKHSLVRLLRSEIITIRVSLGESALLFAFPACTCTYINGESQTGSAVLMLMMPVELSIIAANATTSMSPAPSSSSRECAFSGVDPCVCEETFAEAMKKPSIDGDSSNSTPRAGKAVETRSSQTDCEGKGTTINVLCSACHRVASHVRDSAEENDTASNISMDIVAQALEHPVPSPSTSASTYVAQRAAIPAHEGIPRELVPDCAEDELVFTEVAELRIYRAGFEAASDAAAHIPPAHHKVPDIPRRYAHTQRDRDVFCFGYWEFHYLRGLTDLGNPLSAEYYLGMMAKEKDLVMMPGTRPYQETRAWRLGWCDDWYLTNHPMRNGQRSCRSWT